MRASSPMMGESYQQSDRSFSPTFNKDDDDGQMPSEGLEDDLQLTKFVAETQWANRVLFFACLQLLVALFLMIDGYGVYQILPIGLSCYAIFGVKYKNTECVFVYLQMTFIHMLEALFVILNAYQGFVAITVGIVDVGLLCPLGAYCGFYLYQIMKTGKLMHAESEAETNQNLPPGGRRDSFESKLTRRGIRDSPTLSARAAVVDVPNLHANSYQNV